MKKIILISLLVLLAGGYSGLWFYRAKVTDQYLTSTVAEIEKTGVAKISYASAKVKGFPFSFRVEIKDFHAEVKGPTTPQESLKVDVPLITVSTNFIGDTYHVTYQDLVAVQKGMVFLPNAKPSPENAEATGQGQWITKLPSSEWNITFTEIAWRDILDGQLDFRKAIALDYQNDVATTTVLLDEKDAKEEEAFTGGPTSVHFKSRNDEKGETTDISLNTSISHSFASFEAFKTVALDFDLQGIKPNNPDIPMDLTIRHLGLKVDNMAVDAKGEVHHEKTDPQPTGKIELILTNYAMFLDKLHADDPKPFVEKLKEILHTVADTIDDANATLTISREAGKEIYFGKTPFSQVIAMYQEALKAKQPQEAAPAEDTAPSQPKE